LRVSTRIGRICTPLLLGRMKLTCINCNKVEDATPQFCGMA
jgi:hypothetical protein